MFASEIPIFPSSRPDRAEPTMAEISPLTSFRANKEARAGNREENCFQLQ